MPRSGRAAERADPAQAALSHMAVSKALLMTGMLAPKLLFAAAFDTALTDFSPPTFSLTPGATSVARSHDPISWERATEKSRST
jgi:hypothetical protein